MCQINAPFGENLTKSEIIGLNTQFGSFLFPTKFSLNNQFVVIFKLKIVFWFDYLLRSRCIVWTEKIAWKWVRHFIAIISRSDYCFSQRYPKGNNTIYIDLFWIMINYYAISVELLSYLNFSFSDLSIFDVLIFFRTGQSRRGLRSEEKNIKNHQKICIIQD